MVMSIPHTLQHMWLMDNLLNMPLYIYKKKALIGVYARLIDFCNAINHSCIDYLFIIPLDICLTFFKDDV